MSSHTEKTIKKWRIPAEAKALPPPKLSDPWPQPPSLPPSSDKDKRKKHRQARRKTQARKVDYLEKGQMHKDRYVYASFDRDTNHLTSKHQSLLPDLPRQPNADGVPIMVPFSSSGNGLVDNADREKTLFSCR